MINQSPARLSRLQAAMRGAGADTVAVVPGANLRYLAGLDMHMNERLSVAFFPAEGQPAIVLPALEAPRAKAQARFPIGFYAWDDAAGPAEALRRCVADLGLASQRRSTCVAPRRSRQGIPKSGSGWPGWPIRRLTRCSAWSTCSRNTRTIPWPRMGSVGPAD